MSDTITITAETEEYSSFELPDYMQDFFNALPISE